MADDGDGENGGALLSDPVDVVIDKLLRYGKLSVVFVFCARVCWYLYERKGLLDLLLADSVIEKHSNATNRKWH